MKKGIVKEFRTTERCTLYKCVCDVCDKEFIADSLDKVDVCCACEKGATKAEMNSLLVGAVIIEVEPKRKDSLEEIESIVVRTTTGKFFELLVDNYESYVIECTEIEYPTNGNSAKN